MPLIAIDDIGTRGMIGSRSIFVALFVNVVTTMTNQHFVQQHFVQRDHFWIPSARDDKKSKHNLDNLAINEYCYTNLFNQSASACDSSCIQWL